MTALHFLNVVSAVGLAVVLMLLARGWRTLVELQHFLSGVDIANRRASLYRHSFTPSLTLPESVTDVIESGTKLLVLSESCEECRAIMEQLVTSGPGEYNDLVVGIRGAWEGDANGVLDRLAGKWAQLPIGLTEEAIKAVGLDVVPLLLHVEDGGVPAAVLGSGVAMELRALGTERTTLQ